MNFIDRMFLLWHSNSAMAAATTSGTVYFAMICFPLGVISYANTFVAQYEGNGQPWRVGPVVWQAVWLSILFTPLFLIAIPLAPALFAVAGHEERLLQLGIVYLQIMAWGAGGMVIATALSTFYTGRGATRVVMLVDTWAAVCNIVLDYGMIFGHFGLPELGMAGAAWATVIALWSKVIIYLALIFAPRFAHKYHTREVRLDWSLLRRLVRFGAPSGLQMATEMVAITLLIMLIGHLGEEEMVVTSMAFTINSVAFMPLMGLGLAVSTIVGNQLGQDCPRLAERATWNACRIAVTYAGIMAAFYVLAPDLFLMGHKAGLEADNFDRLRGLTIVLLRFVGAYCVFDAIAITFISAIKGAGDMRFVLLATLSTAIPPVLIAWSGIRFFNLGLIWCWVVITGWVLSLGMVYLLRFLQGKWKAMRVIEPIVIEPAERAGEVAAACLASETAADLSA